MSQKISELIETKKTDEIKIDSLTDVARFLYKNGQRLAFGDLDMVKPFISCGNCSDIKEFNIGQIYKF
jgi:hypothetical protein